MVVGIVELLLKLIIIILLMLSMPLLWIVLRYAPLLLCTIMFLNVLFIAIFIALIIVAAVFILHTVGMGYEGNINFEIVTNLAPIADVAAVVSGAIAVIVHVVFSI